MDTLIKTFLDYYNQKDFREFQNTLAQEIYHSLGTSYSDSDGEVKMVTDMCKTINGKKFDKFRFHAVKIHGSRSYVKFFNQDKPTTKELADMVIISVATKKREIIYEKTAFIQNKKEDSENTWKIDQDQLYLLHNFPTFNGERGIFKKYFDHEVIFWNYSEALGNYGLFQQPGEMILVNALTVFKLQQGNKISFSDIKKYAHNNIAQNNSLQLPLFDYPFDNVFYEYLRYLPGYDLPSLNLPFLNNCRASFNIYEFIRNWSLFNIGETVSAYGKVSDNDLRNLNQILLQRAGLGDLITDSDRKERFEFENDLILMVARLDLTGQ
jgi:hypothetical protein